jgi:Holliday junction DNA helicase RuvA
MIGRIAGTLVEKHPPQVVVMCHGLGYELDVPMSTFYNLPRTGEPVELLTHFVVREDAQLLFGFLTAAERTAFRQLLKVNGVGPKVALSVLSGLSVDDLAAAVAAQDAARQAHRHRVGHGGRRDGGRLGRAQCAAGPWL